MLADRECVPAAKARVLAAASGGSVARALSDDDGPLAGDRDAALGLLRAARARAVVPRLRAAAALTQHGSKRRDRAALDARLVALRVAHCATLRLIASQASTPLANVDLDAPLRELASGFDAERVDAAYASIVRARQALDRNASPKIVADWLAVRI